jgi:hypothetical protein
LFAPIGVRQTQNATQADPSDTVLLLGDSFAFGWLLPDQHTYAAALQRRFPRRRLINAAAGGWGAADYTKYIKLFCRQIRPREIWIFFNSDDIGRAFKSPLFRVLGDGSLRDGAPQPPNRLKNALNQVPGYQWLIQHSHLAALVRIAVLSGGSASPDQSGKPPSTPGSELSPPDLERAVAMGDALFAKIGEESRRCGTHTTVINTGWRPPSAADAREPTAVFLQRAEARGAFERNGLDFLDLSGSPAMRMVHADQARYSIPIDMHPNERGAKAIFQGYLQALVAEPSQRSSANRH